MVGYDGEERARWNASNSRRPVDGRGCVYERCQVPVSFLRAGLVAWPLRVGLFTEPAAAIREVYKRE
jgi:hypothetical protein